jgi:hypothetical protein
MPQLSVDYYHVMPALPQARVGNIFFIIKHCAGLKKDSSRMTFPPHIT